MALWQATQCKYPGPIQALVNSDGANDLVPLFGDFVVPATLAALDVIEFTGIPAGYVPVDFILALEAIGATATLDIGILNGNYGALLQIDGVTARTCGNEGAAAAAGAAAGILRCVKKDLALVAPTLGDQSTTPNPTSGDRGFGVKILAGFAGVVTGAKMRMTLLCRPRLEGV